jgi:protocatechuate 4,5-dioxygenase beta chain
MAAVRLKAIAANRSGKIVAKIVAGVATSHVPAIGAAIDNGKSGEDYWKPLFKGFEPSK